MAQGRRSILGVWSGAVKPDRATIKVLTGPGVPITLELAAESQAARTRYRYSVRTVREPALDGSFRTFADRPLSFRVVILPRARPRDRETR